VKRRAFIAGLGSAAAWSMVANAQSRLVVGFLISSSDDDIAKPLLKAFRQGLSDLGFVEGKNVLIEYRWANYQYDRLSALANDLVSRQVNVIAATPPVATALAAQAATQTIPIVFITGADPIAAGLVSGINRPGGNITGITIFSGILGPKNLELARALMPNVEAIGLLLNPDNPRGRDLAALQAAALSLRQQLHILPARRDADIDSAFDVIAARKIQLLLVGSDSFFFSRREQLTARAAKIRVPLISDAREFAWAGGLFSYGTSVTDGYHKFGTYVARVLKGEKTSDLPVLQPTKFEFVINLKTANALGLDVPPSLLARADEVIE
jgi:putative ABC transport system substrate-binding protein